MLCIKTGMPVEADIARIHSKDSLVLSGIQTVEMLQKNVPNDCTGIMSFGMCGGLRPGSPVVGQTLIASYLVGPNDETYSPDEHWVRRLFGQTYAYVQPWFSNGQFNTADTPAQRAAIYSSSRAWCIDDESLDVARFAKTRGIPFVILRNVSDQWNDDVSIAATLLNSSGGVNPWQVFKAVITDPIDLIRIGRAYGCARRAECCRGSNWAELSSLLTLVAFACAGHFKRSPHVT